MTHDKKCFVIMPFSETSPIHTERYWTSHFEHFLKPIMIADTKNNLIVERSQAIREDILDEIIVNLVYSKIVVADITDLNANVLWELGVRQSFKNGTVTIAEEGTKIPFDISLKGVITYPLVHQDHPDMKNFKKRLIHAINDCIHHPKKPDSHVLKTLSGRSGIHEILTRDDSLRKIDAILCECEYNKKVLKQCLDIIKVNEGNNGPKNATSDRIRYIATELLTTNRYLDQDSSFYSLVEDYTSWMKIINSSFDNWVTNPEGTQTWLKGNIPSAVKSLNAMQKKILFVKGKIQNIV